MRNFNIKNLAFASVFAVIVAVMSSCGGSDLEKSVKRAMLAGDTTEASFAQLCEIIKSDSRKYSAYIDENGDVDAARLDELVNGIGASLRPARHWNVAAYGVSALQLSIYLERSGSMTPYDTQGGGGELKKAVNDLINFFPGESDAARIYIVNDGVYEYNASVSQFLKDKNIYASTANQGNAAYTDFAQIFSTILEKQGGNQVSVLITDMIYSPKDTKDVSAEKIFNEENSLATSVFKQYPDKAVLVSKVSGSYHGQYYPYNQTSFRYDGKRPFYVFVIADSRTIDRMTGDEAFAKFLDIKGAEATYRFNQPTQVVDVALIPNWEGSRGRYRVARGSELKLEKCEGERGSEIMQFSLAANLSGLGKTEEFLCDADNYELASTSDYKVKIVPIEPSMVKGNNKSYLEGKTHIITFTGRPEARKEVIELKIKNDFPAWVVDTDSQDDTKASAPRFASTTFGIEPFLRGVYEAYSKKGDSYTTISIKVEK